jgi:hypothetical protein
MQPRILRGPRVGAEVGRGHFQAAMRCWHSLGADFALVHIAEPLGALRKRSILAIAPKPGPELKKLQSMETLARRLATETRPR